jgi:outer membrane protein
MVVSTASIALALSPLVLVCLAVQTAVAASASGQRADQPCKAEPADCVAIGQWHFSLGVGLGGRSNPVAGNEDLPIILLPNVSYYGERFFWETDTLGYTLVESPVQMLNLIATVSYEQTFFNDWGVGNFSFEGGSSGAGQIANTPAGGLADSDGVPLPGDLVDTGSDLNGQDLGPAPVIQEFIDLDRLHDRNIAGLAGVEYSLELGAISLGFQALQDISGVHEGHELRAAASRTFTTGEQSAALTVGAEWKDAKTLNYFFGVRESEVDNAAAAYSVGDDLSYYLKIDWRMRLSTHWELRGIVHHRRFGNEVKDSPIVDEDSTTAAFIGGVYHF